MKKVSLLFILATLIIISCSKSGGGSSTVDCATIQAKFSSDVLPIFQASCASGSNCHGTGSNQGPGPLTNYSQISASKSASRSSIASGSMPRGGSLSTADKNKIYCWIDNGGLNN